MSLPAGWKEWSTDDGRKYYHNEETNTTTWDRPGDTPASTLTATGLPTPIYDPRDDVSERDQPGASSDALMHDLDLHDRAADNKADFSQPMMSQPEGLMTLRRDSLEIPANIPLTGGSVDQNRNTGCCGKLCSLDYVRPYFDVSTRAVLKRLLLSLTPFKAVSSSGESDFRTSPDLYGPFWIAISAIMTLGLSSNYALYFEGKATTTDFILFSVAAGLIFGFWLGVPLLALFLVWMSRAKEFTVTYSQLACIYGYSFFALIPVSLLCLIPIGWVKWLASMCGLLLSLSFLFVNLMTDLTSGLPKFRYLLVGLFCAAQFGLYLTYRLYFLNANPDTGALAKATT